MLIFLPKLIKLLNWAMSWNVWAEWKLNLRKNIRNLGNKFRYNSQIKIVFKIIWMFSIRNWQMDLLTMQEQVMSLKYYWITIRTGSPGHQVNFFPNLQNKKYSIFNLKFLGQHQTLHRLQLAIDTNQKQFVTHASVQQLLAAIWYDGLPGFRRLHIVRVSKVK